MTARILERVWIDHWAGTLAMAVVLTVATLAARNSGAVVSKPSAKGVAASVFSIERGR